MGSSDRCRTSYIPPWYTHPMYPCDATYPPPCPSSAPLEHWTVPWTVAPSSVATSLEEGDQRADGQGAVRWSAGRSGVVQGRPMVDRPREPLYVTEDGPYSELASAQ